MKQARTLTETYQISIQNKIWYDNIILKLSLKFKGFMEENILKLLEIGLILSVLLANAVVSRLFDKYLLFRFGYLKTTLFKLFAMLGYVLIVVILLVKLNLK